MIYLNVKILERELQSHPDKSFVQDLLSGLKGGFYTHLDTFQAKNLQSALSDPDAVSDMISQELSKGFIIGPFSKSPFDAYRVSPNRD